jgi:uncharacterized protein (DUF362 family)
MKLTRRRAIIGAGLAIGAGLSAKILWDENERSLRASAFVGRAERYDGSLVDVIKRGLAALGIGQGWTKGKSILLKPNLVEPAIESPHINTHPVMVQAAAEVFLSMGAREVLVAEGQGHVRDSYLVLEQSGLGKMLDEAKLAFVDLNHDDVWSAPNALGFTRLPELFFPQTLRRVDRIVSLAKMKTHHWAGVTLSMKNMFGLMPGTCYGWPKNLLHQRGIFASIVDIVGTAKPDLAIIDGVVGMEGDGPIMGTPRSAGAVVMSANLAAADATAARLMDFDPFRIPYLALASGRIGPIRQRHIEQRGETIASLRQRFALLEHPRMKQFRDG